jgi:hypothetical protein
MPVGCSGNEVMLVDSPARSRTRCSCRSPALRPWIVDSTSYVEGIWSPVLLRFAKNAGKSTRRIQQRIQPALVRRGTFLTSAGPQVVHMAFSAGHHSFFTVELGAETTKATLSDRLRSSCYAARNLARTPPSEDGHRTQRAPFATAVPGRRDRTRLGGERVVRGGDGGHDRHVVSFGVARRRGETIDEAQVQRKFWAR